MNVYVITEFTGHYPVGCAAAVVSSSPEAAALLLNQDLKANGLKGDAKAEDFTLVKRDRPCIYMLNDGNY